MSVKTHKNTAKIDCRWAIGLLFAEGIAYVTRIENYPEKCFYWESGKEPLYFESKRTVDDYAFGMLLNGYPAVVNVFSIFDRIIDGNQEPKIQGFLVSVVYWKAWFFVLGSSLSYTKLLISILLIGMCLSPPCPNRQAGKSLSLFTRLQEK